MRSIIWLYATLLAMSAFSAGGAFLLLWSRKLETQARGPLMGALAIWAASSFLYAVVPSEQVATWFFRLRMSAVAFVPPLILLQALYYRGWERWTERLPVLLMFAIPAITTCSMFFFPHWMYESISSKVVEGIRFIDDPEWGRWFPVHAAYGCTTMLVGLGLYIGFLSVSMKRYRAQTLVLGLTVALTLLAGFASTFVPTFGTLRLDLTAVTFVAMAPAIYWIIITYEGSDLRLIARQALLDEITSAVAVVGKRRQIVDSNHAFRRLSNLTAANLLTELCGDFEFRSEGEAPPSREVSVDVAGDTKYFDVHVTALAGGRGVTDGWLVLAHDVTERALLIEELESYDRMVAHDLRNPLVGGVSFIDLAGLRTGRGTLPEEIKQARRSFTRALDIIKAHLRLARFRSGQELIAQPLDMREIVDSVLAQLGWQIAQTNAHIETPEEWPSAAGDAVLIGQVWSNYISNAIRHGRQPPHIEIGGELLAGNLARFWVQNEGRPADETDAGAEARATDDGSSGLGMGLTIVRRIVERSGGTLGATTANGGGGARYWFTLPAKMPATRPATAAAS